MAKVKIGKMGGGGGAIGNSGANDYSITVDGYLRRLLEVNNQIEVLRREQEQIVYLLLPNVRPELFLDDARRRVYWSNGSIKLGKKSYLFVKTLWLGEYHQAEIVELEENVWTQQMETEEFVARRTISMLVRHTQKNLTEANFPYKIEAVKNFSSRELEGFRLVSLDNQKNIFPSEKAGML